MVKKRTPLLGYNHNVRHASRLFHVQTEDAGGERAYITTQVFLDGSVLLVTREPYPQIETDDELRRRMQRQHLATLKQIRDGLFDERLLGLEQNAALRPTAPTPTPTPSKPPLPVAAPTPLPLAAPSALAALIQEVPPVAPRPEAPSRPLAAPPSRAAPSRPFAPPADLTAQFQLSRFFPSLDHPDEDPPVTAPYAPRARDVTGGNPLDEQELRELLDLATAAIEDRGFQDSANSSQVDPELAGGQVLELLAEPASEDEEFMERGISAAMRPPALVRPGEQLSQRTPSRTTAPTHRSPRQVIWLGDRGNQPPPAEGDSTASRPPHNPRPQSPFPEAPAQRTPLVERRGPQSGPDVRITGARPRPQPTAEGVMIQRPVILDKGRRYEAGAQGTPAVGTQPVGGTDPKLPSLDDDHSLDQVILAYLAEEIDQRQK